MGGACSIKAKAINPGSVLDRVISQVRYRIKVKKIIKLHHLYEYIAHSPQMMMIVSCTNWQITRKQEN